MGNSTSCKIVTPENFILKFCTHDYVGETTRHAHFGFNRYSGGFSPNRWNITTLWLFWLYPVLFWFSCPYVFFSILRADRTAGPIFTLYCSNDVFLRKDDPFGSKNDGWNMLLKPPKLEWIGNFKPRGKIEKIAISPKRLIRSRPNLRTKLKPKIALHRHLTSSISNPIWLPVAILEKWIWRHNSASDRPITTTFGRQTSNNMTMTAQQCTYVEIDTGNKIPIWRPSVFGNRK